MCSYRSLLLNYLSTPMVIIYSFIWSNRNNPFSMIYCYSNDSIWKIDSRNLVNALDLAHYASWAVFPTAWKLKYSLPNGWSFWRVIRVVVLCWHYIVSYCNKNWVTGAVTLWLLFMGVVKHCDSSSTVTFISNMFVVCGIDTGLFWMVSYVVSLTAVFGLEY